MFASVEMPEPTQKLNSFMVFFVVSAIFFVFSAFILARKVPNTIPGKDSRA